MECEEEELEPWQKKVKEVEDDDDDEPIFVGEISSSKPAISSKHLLLVKPLFIRYCFQGGRKCVWSLKGGVSL